MNSIAIGLTVFACTFGGALAGPCLRVVIPDRHLNGDSRNVVKLGTGPIAMKAALVLDL